MKRRDPADLPRWLGVGLAIAGILVVVVVAVAWLALAAEQEWPDYWWLLTGLGVLGALAEFAGFRILRAHRQGP